MSNELLSVRELQRSDIDSIIRYWLDADATFLERMGVDLQKMPSREESTKMLLEQLNQLIKEKKSYCIIWLVEHKAIGHSNVNKIIFGQEAYMHIHLWDQEVRKKGYGQQFVKMTLPYFLEKLNLKKLYCEPYALNSAPNKMLDKVGFKLVREYTTIPGWLNFEQPVKL